MKFIIRYKNNIFHLYEFYYDTKKNEYVQLFYINDNYDIILKTNKSKIMYGPEYLQNISKK